ncbi:hypothetical protein QFZ94_007494 [Paraburkholderia sp. JPY465]|uniref:hypothetical protein n=1 Tax=Paraburkholderia sp. JPY465 TaxID=3042285 RepID=UPI003D2057E5
MNEPMTLCVTLDTQALRKAMETFASHVHVGARGETAQLVTAACDAYDDEHEMRSRNLMTVRALPCDYSD